MGTFVGYLVDLLGLLPATLAFFLPALAGVALLKERGPGYTTKAALVFALGFGGIVAVQLVLGSPTALQALALIGISLVQIAAALSLAAFTVYRLAD